MGVVDITISIDPSSATLYDTNEQGETHPTAGGVNLPDSCELAGPPTISNLNISYTACQSFHIDNSYYYYYSYGAYLPSACYLVATLVTTPAGTYTYSVDAEMSNFYEISNNNKLYRRQDWFEYTQESSNIPTSVVIATTNTATNETFDTTLTITYDPYDPEAPC